MFSLYFISYRGCNSSQSFRELNQADNFHCPRDKWFDTSAKTVITNITLQGQLVNTLIVALRNVYLVTADLNLKLAIPYSIFIVHLLSSLSFVFQFDYLTSF